MKSGSSPRPLHEDGPEALVAAGEERLVREYRLRFQETIAPAMTQVAEQLTGRSVLAYHSQVVSDPEQCFEIFVLDGAPEANQP